MSMVIQVLLSSESWENLSIGDECWVTWIWSFAALPSLRGIARGWAQDALCCFIVIPNWMHSIFY